MHRLASDRPRGRDTSLRATGARETTAAVTWDQVVIWLIVPAIVAHALGLGGIWLSRRIP
jgi:hypothetical protein